MGEQLLQFSPGVCDSAAFGMAMAVSVDRNVVLKEIAVRSNGMRQYQLSEQSVLRCPI
jgi:hypothetical protein